MPDDIGAIAAALRERAAKAVGQHLSERAFLRPDSDEEAKALAVISEEIEGENRRRVAKGSAPLPQEAKESIATVLYDGLFGLGPLQPFLDDPDVEELIVNGSGRAFVLKAGGLKEEVPSGLSNDEELRALMVRAAARVGRRLDEGSPAVDVQLPEGRLHAIIPPITRFACLTIRRQRLAADDLSDLVQLGTITEHAAAFLSAAVQGGLNILVSGGTASGKTTTLHALGRAIPEWERVITVEETAELQLEAILRDSVGLEARFANVEGLGKFSIRDLVRNALRMRPSRIIVGEVRGAEALDMLAAMNSGHEGSMCTIHASSARQALSKLQIYVLMAEEGLGPQVASQMIAETIDLVLQLRLEYVTGKRLVQSIVEIAGMEGGRVLVNEVFRREGADLRHSGLRPRCAERLEERGIKLPWLGEAA